MNYCADGGYKPYESIRCLKRMTRICVKSRRACEHDARKAYELLILAHAPNGFSTKPRPQGPAIYIAGLRQQLRGRELKGVEGGSD